MNNNLLNAIMTIAGWFGIRFVAEKSSSVIIFGMCLVFIFGSIVLAGFYNQALRDKKKEKAWRTD